jgi:hypothetical protein
VDAGCGSTDTTANCGECGRECSTTNASSTTCGAGGVCAPTCKTGYSSCSHPASPAADNGCECASPGCCQGGCAVSHENCIGTGSECGSGTTKIGQTYFIAADYCTVDGTPGTDSTYTVAMATAAAAAAPQPSTTACSQPPCIGVSTCTTKTTAQDVYYVDLTDTGGPCYVWAFKTTGSGATKAPSGYVHMDTTQCSCPTSADPTWD